MAHDPFSFPGNRSALRSSSFAPSGIRQKLLDHIHRDRCVNLDSTIPKGAERHRCCANINSVRTELPSLFGLMQHAVVNWAACST